MRVCWYERCSIWKRIGAELDGGVGGICRLSTPSERGR